MNKNSCIFTPVNDTPSSSGSSTVILIDAPNYFTTEYTACKDIFFCKDIILMSMLLWRVKMHVQSPTEFRISKERTAWMRRHLGELAQGTIMGLNMIS